MINIILQHAISGIKNEAVRVIVARNILVSLKVHNPRWFFFCFFFFVLFFLNFYIHELFVYHLAPKIDEAKKELLTFRTAYCMCKILWMAVY